LGGVKYVNCASCGKQYYLVSNLYKLAKSNPDLKLKCPFCKKEFTLKEPTGS